MTSPPESSQPAPGTVLSVVVPVFNEAATVAHVLERVLGTELPVQLELIAVDDGSSDASLTILEGVDDPRLRVIRHADNAGKGASIRTGLAAATGDIVVIQDADLEYDPADWADLLPPLLSGEVDVVYGSRFMGSPEGMQWQNRMANQFLSALTSVLYRQRLTDMETCYKLIRRSVFTSLELTADRFDIEPEITAQLLRRGIEIRELPISYSARSQEDGKKIGYRDGLAAIVTLIRWRFARS